MSNNISLNSFSFPLRFQQIGPVLILLFLSIAAWLFNDALIHVAEYSREHIVQHQWWRFFTSPFFHTNTNHLLLNLFGLFLLWALHGDEYSFSRLTIVFVISALFVSLGMYWFTPEIMRCVGLSGVLHGLFVWGACMDIQSKRTSGYLLLLGVAIKIIAEQVQGPDLTLGQWISAQVAIDSHLYGALGGFAAFAITFVLSKRKGAEAPL